MPRDNDGVSDAEPWDGGTYYNRPQLKPAPFNKGLVGGYIFLAGLSGGAQLLASLIELVRGRRAAAVVRRGRLLALAAPTLGAGLLVADLHTPQRFYNMLRVFKRTSPMSIGTWTLMLFTVASGVTSGAEALAGRLPFAAKWLRRVARGAQIPAAAAGGELGTYTAALLSATSTPSWAASPRALAVRFGASSIASAAAALGLGEGRSRLGRDLDTIAALALAVELAAGMATTPPVPNAETPKPDLTPILPLGLLLGAMLSRRRSPLLSGVAALSILGSSLALRVGTLESGDASARDPKVSLRFARPRG